MVLDCHCNNKCNDCKGRPNFGLVNKSPEPVRNTHKTIAQLHSHHEHEHEYTHKKCNPHRHNNSACGMVSVKNPTTELLIPELLIQNISNAAHVSVTLKNWSDVIIDASDSFDNSNGLYTTPENGDYEFNLVVNYETSVPLQVSPTLNDVPSVQLYNWNTGEPIIESTLPASNMVFQVPPPSSGEPPVDISVSNLLGKAQAVISVIVPLEQGQQVGVRVNSNGLTYLPPLVLSEVFPQLPARIVFSPERGDTTLTIKKVRNTPIITIDCNN